MPERLITAPAAEPVSLSEARTHLRVTSNAEDALISSLISAARDLCERETGRALMPQTWELSLDGFCNAMKLGRAPVASIISVKYTDVNGVEQTLAASEYVFDNASDIMGALVLPPNKSWPQVYAGINAVRIRYVSGYANAAAVPQALKQWMLLQISHWFRNRESVGMNGAGGRLEFVDNLLNAYRIYNI